VGEITVHGFALTNDARLAPPTSSLSSLPPPEESVSPRSE
jgi:hypothetical protein